jgi:capsular polysaccharide transport system permease protein
MNQTVVQSAPTTVLVSIGHILRALMLRNIRTRFFGTGLGFLLALSWPLVHMGLLLTISIWFGRLAPYGESSAVFFATGLVPFMAFLYISRFMMVSVQHTRPLLTFPIVKITDLLAAGAILEVLSSCCSVIVLAIVLTSFGIDISPLNPAQAAFALCSSMLLGLAFGTFNSLLLMAMPIWMTVSSLLHIFLYATSGIFFVPSSLPPTVRYYLSYNPLLQNIEWMRSAYYDGYGDELLNKPYAVGFAVVLLAIGLVIERVFRGRYLIK